MRKFKLFTATWYFPWYYALMLSFCIALYLSWATQFISIVELITMRIFWQSISFSWLLGFFLVWEIGFTSLRLDVLIPWKRGFWRRLYCQSFWGIAVPLGLVYVFVRFIFFPDKASFQESGYLTLEFPLVQASVLALNFLYFGCSRWYSVAKEVRLKGSVGMRTYTVAPSDIILLKRQGNTGSMYLKDGTEMCIDYLMEDLEQLLSAENFYRISRSVMVSLASIASWKTVKNGQYLLKLQVDLLPETNLLVSRNRKPGLDVLLKKQLFAVKNQLSALQASA